MKTTLILTLLLTLTCTGLGLAQTTTPQPPIVYSPNAPAYPNPLGMGYIPAQVLPPPPAIKYTK